MSLRLLVSQPPSTGNASLDMWLRQLADAINVVTEIEVDRIAAGSVTAETIAVDELSELTDDAGILVHGELQGANVTINLDAAGSQPIISSDNVTIRANGAVQLGDHVTIATNGDVTFSGDLDAASGTFSGTVSAGGTIEAASFEATSATFTGEVEVEAGAGVVLVGLYNSGGDGVVQINTSTSADDFTISNGGTNELVVEHLGPNNPTFVIDMDAQVTADLEIDGDLNHDGSGVGFYGTAPITKPTVSGSRADPEQALADLLQELENLGLISDTTTA